MRRLILGMLFTLPSLGFAQAGVGTFYFADRGKGAFAIGVTASPRRGEFDTDKVLLLLTTSTSTRAYEVNAEQLALSNWADSARTIALASSITYQENSPVVAMKPGSESIAYRRAKRERFGILSIAGKEIFVTRDEILEFLAAVRDATQIARAGRS